MGAADVLQPVLAPVGDDPEHPGVEPAVHLGEVLVRLDERRLQDVLRYVGAPGHPERVSVQRVAVSLDEGSEGVPVACQDPGDHVLILLQLIDRLDGHRGGLHAASIILFPLSGQPCRAGKRLREGSHTGCRRPATEEVTGRYTPGPGPLAGPWWSCPPAGRK